MRAVIPVAREMAAAGFCTFVDRLFSTWIASTLGG
jgi:hypothetical protein